MFAKIIKEENHDFDAPCAGRFKVYEIRNKRGSVIKYLYADYAHCKFDGIIDFDNIDETMVFECNKDGTVTKWNELWFGAGDCVTDDSAIKDMGYFLYT